MFSRVARRTPLLARGMATVAKSSHSNVASIAMAAAAGAAAAATLGFTAQAESTMDVLKGISGQLSSIEEAVVFAPALAKIGSIKKSHPGNLAVKDFDFDYFASLSSADKKALLAIVNSGVQNADSGMGCYAMNPTDYDKFEPFFGAVISDYHGVPRSQHHVTDWKLDGVAGLPADGKLDVTKLGLPPVSMRVRVGRNLADFPLPGAMNKDDRVAMEAKMQIAFVELKKKYGGRYHSLTPGNPDFITDDEYKALVKAHVMFKDMAADTYLSDAGIASDWPFGRGCYQSEDKGFIIWVGEEDHLRIMCMEPKGSLINGVFERLKTALDTVESIEGLKFAHSEKYGYVTSCPTNLGTGMRASVLMKIPKLCKGGSDANAKKVCKPLGLGVRGMGGEHTAIGADGTCDISPTARFCISEAEIVTALYTGIKNLKAAEDSA